MKEWNNEIMKRRMNKQRELINEQNMSERMKEWKNEEENEQAKMDIR